MITMTRADWLVMVNESNHIGLDERPSQQRRDRALACTGYDTNLSVDATFVVLRLSDDDRVDGQAADMAKSGAFLVPSVHRNPLRKEDRTNNSTGSATTAKS